MKPILTFRQRVKNAILTFFLGLIAILIIETIFIAAMLTAAGAARG